MPRGFAKDDDNCACCIVTIARDEGGMVECEEMMVLVTNFVNGFTLLVLFVDVCSLRLALSRL